MGNEADFENNYKYNFDSQVSLSIDLSKTCYVKGEWIRGTLYLKTKPYLQERILLSPEATVIITELHHGELSESDYDIYEKKETPENNSLEEKNLLTCPMNLSQYNGANLYNGISIAFGVQIPLNCYPSCIFDSNTYVRHFLTINFTSIKAKKSVVIIIKNNQYFSYLNKLFKSPTIYTKEISKHQYALFNKGSFTTTITLPKNSFAYDEIVPFKVEIDCSKLNINIKSIKVSLNIIKKIHEKGNLKEIKLKTTKEVVSKIIPLTIGNKIYPIDDMIKLPTTMDNPKCVYKKLDSDKRNFHPKFDNIVLYQSCYDGIITCEYNIRIMLEMDTLFSTNEFLEIPLDFYEPNYLNNQNDDSLPTLEDISKNNLENSKVGDFPQIQNNMINYSNTAQTNTNNINNNNYSNNNFNNNPGLNIQQPQFPNQINNQYPNYNEIINNNANNINMSNNLGMENNNNIYSNNINNNNSFDDNNKNKDITDENIEDSDAPPTIGQMMSKNNN